MSELPKENKQIDNSIPVPEKLYEITGFVSKQEAEELIKKLVSLYPSNAYDIKIQGHFEPDMFSAIIPKGALKYLDEEKITNTVELKPNIQVDSFSPRLFRFMDENYIDEFLEIGTLFISSYKRCHNLENQNRKDKSEGKVSVVGTDGKNTLEIVIGVPDNSFLLCTSLSENNVFPNGEVYSACLEIVNLDGFIESITDALIKNGYQVDRLLYGACNYGQRLIINQKTNMDFQEIIPDKTNKTIDFERIFRAQNAIAGESMYFRKGLEKAYEHEYRIIWNINNCKEDHITIKVPEAIKYCQKKVY